MNSSLGASTLRQIVRRKDGAANVLVAAYRSGPLGLGMQEAFGRALGAGAPIPDALRTGTFDIWVSGFGRQSSLVEMLWNDAANLCEDNSEIKWDDALHRAARKYRDSRHLTSDDSLLDDKRVEALLRRLREAGCL
jgi:hypothetical protein